MLIYYRKCIKGFTLAEMMVVMLILTIILAAFAPLMTKRKMVDMSNPWRYAANNSDVYYGLGATQTAMIGQSEKGASENARLIINTVSRNQDHIKFKTGDSAAATLKIDQNNLLFGSGYSELNSGSNTALGISALYNVSTGGGNTAIGRYTMNANTTGTNNVGIGYNSLRNSKGSYNTAVGTNSLYNLSSGSYNTAIGNYACQNVTTGSNKTCIGANSGPVSGSSGTTDNNKIIYIGTSDTNVYIPGNLIVGKQTYLGPSLSNFAAVWLRTWQETGYLGVDVNGDTRHALHFTNVESGNDDPHAVGYPSWVGTIISDKRLKNVGKPNIDGLDKINSLKVYNYTLKNDTAKTPRVGVIAQDLQDIFPNAVKKGKDGYLSIRQEDMFYAMVNAVQQLDTLVQGLISEVKTALFKISAHEKEIQALQKENAELKTRIEKLEKLLY